MKREELETLLENLVPTLASTTFCMGQDWEKGDGSAVKVEPMALKTAHDIMTAIDQHTAQQVGQWWITTGLSQGGKKLLGPFNTRDLALSVRTYMEIAEAPATYWVEADPSIQATLTNKEEQHDK